MDILQTYLPFYQAMKCSMAKFDTAKMFKFDLVMQSVSKPEADLTFLSYRRVVEIELFQ
jgi:hypothetical protein